LKVKFRRGPEVELQLLAPERKSKEPARVELVESNPFYRWERFHFTDAHWPRVIEVRADFLGQVVVVAHLQRNLTDAGRAPDFGWQLQTHQGSALLKHEGAIIEIGEKRVSHSYTNGASCVLSFDLDGYSVYHPAAPLKRRGHSEAQKDREGVVYRYYRCNAAERVPMQPASWQRAELVIAPARLAPLT